MSAKRWTIGAMALAIGAAAWAAAVAAPAATPASHLSKLALGGAGVEWLPQIADYDRLVLTVSGPQGFAVTQEFKAGVDPSLSLFDAQGQRLADGHYAWEL